MKSLSGVRDDNEEESPAAIRQARATAAAARIQAGSVERGLHKTAPKEIEAEIKKARRIRPKGKAAQSS